jgi:hypothetical protein
MSRGCAGTVPKSVTLPVRSTDLQPIAAVLEQGCNIDLDVLPAVRDMVAIDGQPPLKSWGVPWLAEEIIRRRDARMDMETVHTSNERLPAGPVGTVLGAESEMG